MGALKRPQGERRRDHCSLPRGAAAQNFSVDAKEATSDHHWRKRINLEWDEALFRAVFRPLAKPTKPTVVPCPKNLAMTLDGAWASSSVRMLQVIATPGKILCDFLALDDFQRSPLYLASGYAFKHIDIRFVLELAAVFECKYSKLPGNRMKVSVYVTVARVSADGIFFDLLPDPKRSSSDVMPVLLDFAIRQEVLCCVDSMKDWHTPHSANLIQNTPSQVPLSTHQAHSSDDTSGSVQ